MFAKEILANPDPVIAHCHCPAIAIAPTGDVLVTWYAYPEIETRDSVLVLARKPFGQARFDRPVRILSDMRSSLGNPVLFFGDGGRLHLLFVSLAGQYWNTAALNAAHSDDLGRTWSAPESCRCPAGMMVRYPPIVRNNGYLLLPAYDETKNQTALLTAGPDATGWFPVTHFEDLGVIQGSFVRQSETQLAMMLRPCGDSRVCYRAISGDDGRSWSRALPTSLPNPLSGVAAFELDGMFCAVYNHTTEHRRYPLSLSYSTDRGTSWTGPFHIDETEHEVSYPSFTTDSRGMVHGVYTLGRTRIQYVTFDRHWWMN